MLTFRDRDISRLARTKIVAGNDSTDIAYDSVAPSPYGPVAVVVTERGIRSLTLGAAVCVGTTSASSQQLSQRACELAQTLQERLATGAEMTDLLLDVIGTEFQRLVWNHLRTIPRGSVATYADVANAIGRPRAARAVARACACNAVALAIPCHRVVQSNGSLGGYRWGVTLKRQLLTTEGALVSGTAQTPTKEVER